MAKKPIAYPPANQQIQITPAEWASWISELPDVAAGEPVYYSASSQDDLPVIPPIINEAHQGPQNVITAETLKATSKSAPAQNLPAPTASARSSERSVGSEPSALTLQDQDLSDDDFDIPAAPEIDENYTSLTKATSGPKHLERALYGQVNPLLVAEYVFAIADETTLAQAYGMTVPELRKTITTQPFQTAADSLRKAWETNPQLDTQYRAKQAFEYLLPIAVAKATDPKAHPGLVKSVLELTAKIGNIMPKESTFATGGNTFAIQIILPGVESKSEDEDFRVINGDEL